jgi:hypothetical protein
VLTASLALVLGATPTLWLSIDVGPKSPCRLDALAAAIRVQRPDAALSLGAPPHPSDLEAVLADRDGTLILSVHGGQGRPLSRELPPAGATCEEALQTAALMIDRYLDELHATGADASIESLAPGPGPAFGVQLGPSVVQAPFGLSAGLILELDLRVGLFLLSLGGEANLSQSKAIGSALPDATYDVTPAATWLAAGVAPRLGPGRLFGQLSLGLSILWARARSPSLFQTKQGLTVDPYVGLCAGYVLDLPAHFGLALRYEERWVPAPTAFAVEGLPGTVSVRALSGDLALLVGYTFF